MHITWQLNCRYMCGLGIWLHHSLFVKWVPRRRIVGSRREIDGMLFSTTSQLQDLNNLFVYVCAKRRYS